MYQEASALEIEIPDRLTGRLSRKYGLKLSKSERHERRVQYIALAFAAIFFTAIWFPQTVTAVVNVFHELVFVDNGRSMDVNSRTRADSSFSIEVPENFLSDGTFLIGNNAVRTRYQSPEEYIEITEYSAGYKLSYDNEELDSKKDVTVNAYSGMIFRKNGVTTLVLDYSGVILEMESSLPEEAKRLLLIGIVPVVACHGHAMQYGGAVTQRARQQGGNRGKGVCSSGFDSQKKGHLFAKSPSFAQKCEKVSMFCAKLRISRTRSPTGGAKGAPAGEA